MIAFTIVYLFLCFIWWLIVSRQPLWVGWGGMVVIFTTAQIVTT